jgi:type I restriction enzyme, S subunit
MFRATQWKTAELGDICTFGSGSGFGLDYQEQNDGEHPFIKVSDLNLPGNEKWVQVANHWVSDADLAKLKAKLFPPRTVVFAKVGAALRLNRRRLLSRLTAIDNNLMAAIPDESRIEAEYLYYVLTTHDFGRFCQESAVPSINQSHVTSIVVDLPPLAEQRRIAEILRTWDDAIETTERLIAAKKKAFDHWSLMLFSGRRRLDKKRSNWQSVTLTEVTTEATKRNPGSEFGTDTVMGVNKVHGMIPMKDHVRADDLSRYKIVGLDAFAYNPMRLNIGSIAQNLHGRNVLVSPDYVAFEARPEALLPSYFDHMRRTWLWSHFVKTAGSGGVRIRIYYKDLADFVFDLPTLEEQRRIVEVLYTGRREITLIEDQRDALTRQKRGLMQKLLTGEWPVSVDDAKEAAE